MAQSTLDAKIVENVVAETVGKCLPTVLARFLSLGNLLPPPDATQQVGLASFEQPKGDNDDLGGKELQLNQLMIFGLKADGLYH